MGLASLANIESQLMCPRCVSPLVRTPDAFRCSNDSCGLSASASFPLVDGRPVLVDFDQSVLRREDLIEAGRIEAQVVHRWSVDRVPAGLRSVLKPPNEAARRNTATLLSLLRPGATVLVVGGGTIGNGTERLYTAEGVEVVAFDIYDSPYTQFLADAHQIPLSAGTVDAVVVQAVLEHVLDAGRVVAEVHRVLREDGVVYAETPFLQQVHAGPYDFVRFTGSGHRYLFRQFDELGAGPVAGPGTQFLWSVDHLVRAITRSELAGKLVRALLFPFRYLDRVAAERYAVDDASAFYFLGRRSNRELGPEEIIAYYGGAQRDRIASKTGH
jgi:ubiquinone/menaquinone biosynthesis C-methylase UbiE